MREWDSEGIRLALTQAEIHATNALRDRETARMNASFRAAEPILRQWRAQYKAAERAQYKAAERAQYKAAEPILRQWRAQYKAAEPILRQYEMLQRKAKAAPAAPVATRLVYVTPPRSVYSLNPEPDRPKPPEPPKRRRIGFATWS